jgi:hypothetical protein
LQRDPQPGQPEGTGRSKGYGFVQYVIPFHCNPCVLCLHTKQVPRSGCCKTSSRADERVRAS